MALFEPNEPEDIRRTKLNTLSNQVSGVAWDGVSVVFNGPTKGAVYTVASLPAASASGIGSRAFVSDATATTFASVAAGGGGNGVPVYSDGTSWRIG